MSEKDWTQINIKFDEAEKEKHKQIEREEQKISWKKYLKIKKTRDKLRKISKKTKIVETNIEKSINSMGNWTRWNQKSFRTKRTTTTATMTTVTSTTATTTNKRNNLLTVWINAIECRLQNEASIK